MFECCKYIHITVCVWKCLSVVVSIHIIVCVWKCLSVVGGGGGAWEGWN